MARQEAIGLPASPAPGAPRPTPHLDAVKRERDEALAAAAELGRTFAAQAEVLLRARRERDSLTRLLAVRFETQARATRLVELAMHLRMHGERAPGGNETWAEFDRMADQFLHACVPSWGPQDASEAMPEALFGGDAGPEWMHEGACSWPERACTGHMPSYWPVQVPENTGKHQAELDPIGSNADIFCRNPSCPDYGDPNFGEGTCPAEHADQARWGCLEGDAR